MCTSVREGWAGGAGQPGCDGEARRRGVRRPVTTARGGEAYRCHSRRERDCPFSWFRVTYQSRCPRRRRGSQPRTKRGCFPGLWSRSGYPVSLARHLARREPARGARGGRKRPPAPQPQPSPNQHSTSGGRHSHAAEAYTRPRQTQTERTHVSARSVRERDLDYRRRAAHASVTPAKRDLVQAAGRAGGLKRTPDGLGRVERDWLGGC